MMFSELASIRVDGAKQAALLLHSLAPADRSWVLSQLDANQHGELQPLIAELDDMGLSSDLTALNRDALGQGMETAGGTPALGLLARAASAAPADKTALSDVEYLRALGPEDVISLARTWSVEQPELVAYALRIQQWLWHEALLERLPVAQRGRVQGALESTLDMSPESKLAIAVMTRMRKCCEASWREGSSTSSVTKVSKPDQNGATTVQLLQSLLQGWKRWTTGLRREAP